METQGEIRTLSLLGGARWGSVGLGGQTEAGALHKVHSVEGQSPGRFTVG